MGCDLSDCRLITGITGLLGQYLLCETLRKREPVSVLVRGRRGISASDRVDQLLSTWEQRLGLILPRPVVLEGDLRNDGLSLTKEAADWFRRNVNSVVHSAASVLFHESSSGEPMKSNVEGTRHLLNFCRDSSVREFHFVSSAYTCGKVSLSTPVLEELHPQGGPFGNIYQRSKCLAEHLVVQSEGKFTRTIYRPSTIIGEWETGYAPSFNAIYTPLRLAWSILREPAFHHLSEKDFLQEIGTEGTESRNIVPVDWVSQAINSIVRQPSRHGEIYHLTNPAQTEDREIVVAMERALRASVTSEYRAGRFAGNTEKPEEINLDVFRHQMEAFRSYFHADPPFDNSRFSATGICPPCPPVGEMTLTRAFDFAVAARFENHEITAALPLETEPRRRVEKLIAHSDTSRISPAVNGASNSTNHKPSEQSYHFEKNTSLAEGLRLALSGSGGGCWQICLDPSGVRCDMPNVRDDEGCQFYGSAVAFRAWLEGEFSLEDGIRSGLFVITGSGNDLECVSELIFRLRAELRPANTTNDSGIEAFEPQRLLTSGNVLAAGRKSF